MKTNILIYISFITIFLLPITLMAQTNAVIGSEDGTVEIEEAPPYDKKWTVDITGDFFENQRTAPLIIIDSVENVYLAGTFSNELKINEFAEKLSSMLRTIENNDTSVKAEVL